MRTSSIVTGIAAFFTLAQAKSVLAASFCVVGVAIPPQCMYDSVDVCNGASSPPNTYCDVNPDAHLMYYGSMRYCAVSSDLLAQCRYNSRTLCDQDTASSQSVCIDRGEVPTAVTPNPYRYDSRTQE